MYKSKGTPPNHLVMIEAHQFHSCIQDLQVVLEILDLGEQEDRFFFGVTDLRNGGENRAEIGELSDNGCCFSNFDVSLQDEPRTSTDFRYCIRKGNLDPPPKKKGETFAKVPTGFQHFYIFYTFRFYPPPPKFNIATEKLPSQ